MKLFRNCRNIILSIVLILVYVIISVEMKWIDSIVAYKMNTNISIDKIFSLYIDLPKHPLWSLWLKQVNYNISSGISSWTISKYGLSYHWNANNTLLIHPYIIQWESINGFSNRGKVEFIPIDSNQCMDKTTIHQLSYQNISTYKQQSDIQANRTTLIKMTISYDLPYIAAIVLDRIGSFATDYIERTIVKDLERFENLVIQQYKENE